MKRETKIIDQGIVCRIQRRLFSYFGWPSVARADDGALLMVCSGLRIAHVDPFGKVVMYKSFDEGRTWGGPHIVLDTPLDDRDAGIVNMGGGQVVVTSFNNSRQAQHYWTEKGMNGSPAASALCRAYLDTITDEEEQRFLGAHVIKSCDNGHTWGEPRKVPICAPHGPTLRRNGTLIFAGMRFDDTTPTGGHPISIYTSNDGLAYRHLRDVPASDDPRVAGLVHCEPHILELANGRLVLHIRIEKLFSICQSVSDDGGKTFSVPKLLGNEGSPPHLVQHSSGAVICTYGRRVPPFGIFAMISRDNGDTWSTEQDVWFAGGSRDIGYPCTVELPGGDLFTVFYDVIPGDRGIASILWFRWRLV